MKLLYYLIKTINNCSEALEGKHFENTFNPKNKTFLPIIETPNIPRDTVIATDVSRSMKCKDYIPTRLKGGIEAGIEYVNVRKNLNDRIALVSFSEDAKIILPLTSVRNKEKIIDALQDLRIDSRTDIEKGLQAAVEIFSEKKTSSQRYVILLTDGHGGNPLKTARKLEAQYNAIIEVIGIGGSPDAVNESLLCEVATTDTDGFTHYRFIKDSASLKKHYKNLATGLVWKGTNND